MSLGFSMYGVMSSAGNNSFSFFPNLDSFDLFSYLTDVTRTCKTMFKKSDKSGHLLVPGFRGNAFSFSPGLLWWLRG